MEGDQSCGGRADYGCHASGEADAAAVGEEFGRVAVGAAVGDVNSFISQSRGVQLAAAGFAKIDVALAVVAAAKGRGGWEGVIEKCDDLGADFHCVEADAGADGGDQAVGAA